MQACPKKWLATSGGWCQPPKDYKVTDHLKFNQLKLKNLERVHVTPKIILERRGLGMNSLYHHRGNTKCFGRNGVEQIGHVMFSFPVNVLRFYIIFTKENGES